MTWPKPPKLGSQTQPMRVIRQHCYDCVVTASEIEKCTFTECATYDYRLGKKPKGGKPAKAMKAFCMYCMNGQAQLVRECESGNCAFHPWRFGKSPYRAPSEKQLLALAKNRAKSSLFARKTSSEIDETEN